MILHTLRSPTGQGEKEEQWTGTPESQLVVSTPPSANRGALEKSPHLDLSIFICKMRVGLGCFCSPFQTPMCYHFNIHPSRLRCLSVDRVSHTTVECNMSAKGDQKDPVIDTLSKIVSLER